MPHALNPVGARHAVPVFLSRANRSARNVLRLAQVSALLLLFSVSACAQESVIANMESRTWPQTEHAENPELLSFDELVELSESATPEGALAARYEALINTPFVHEEPGMQPHRPTDPKIGPVLRVAMWNIERGLNFDLIRYALQSRELFDTAVFQETIWHDKQRHDTILAQAAVLRDADVVILNEADWGMKRTDYRDVTRELATSLHMSYVYGVEFLEVDPIFDLGSEEVHVPDANEDKRLQQDLHVDREKYHGLHGTAILSRYPLRNARMFRLPVCYDWYGQEYDAISSLEQGKRWSAEKLFKERIERELRQGGRMALIAEVGVPELPTGEATIVATHLENKCTPACRLRQMTALLDHVRSVQNPVILAGDFNTTSRDNTPTSIRNEIMKRVTDYKFWVGQVISYFNPLGWGKLALYPLHYFHGFNDPTAYHLPIVWDNRERPLFDYIEHFRFDDGHTFDFRGGRNLTAPPRGSTLANSNARQWKGFVPTYAFARDYGGVVGRFKLDWVMVKDFATNPRTGDRPLKFAPTFPITMQELNDAPHDRISDHPPITVDLPLTEPPR